MGTAFHDATAPRWNGNSCISFAEYPHGLISPPREVVDQLAKEKGRHPGGMAPEFEKLLLDDWTLAYYYDGIFIGYRSVPEGVEVLAVGADEIGHLAQAAPPETRRGVIFKYA
jgi:hypothetical protein